MHRTGFACGSSDEYGRDFRLTGEHEAAIRVYTIAIEWTSQPRVRLQALSGALQSAVACRRISEARRLLGQLNELLPTVPDTYATAGVGVEMADSMHKLGDTHGATALLATSRAVAEGQAFHEIVHLADRAARAWAEPPARHEQVAIDARRKRRFRSDDFRMVLRSLRGLSAATA